MRRYSNAWVPSGRELSNANGLQETLQRIVELGEEVLEHCDGPA
jgi:hypothetical protein